MRLDTASTTSPSDTSYQTSAEGPVTFSGDSDEPPSAETTLPPYNDDANPVIPTTSGPLPDVDMCGDVSGSAARDLDFSNSFDFSLTLDPLFFFPDTMEHFNFESSSMVMPQSSETEFGKSSLASLSESSIDKSADVPPAPMQRRTESHSAGGFSMRQIDPVEAKCVEMKALLEVSSEPALDSKCISLYITRENLTVCGALYGQHFQPNVPILHMPTFDVCHASPTLLCAIMLVGACYSDHLIPAACITKLAMRLSLAIEMQPVRSEDPV